MGLAYRMWLQRPVASGTVRAMPAKTIRAPDWDGSQKNRIWRRLAADIGCPQGWLLLALLKQLRLFLCFAEMRIIGTYWKTTKSLGGCLQTSGQVKGIHWFHSRSFLSTHLPNKCVCVCCYIYISLNQGVPFNHPQTGFHFGGKTSSQV